MMMHPDQAYALARQRQLDFIAEAAAAREAGTDESSPRVTPLLRLLATLLARLRPRPAALRQMR